MTGLRIQELLVVLAVLLLFFGARKLPELARSLGQAPRELRKGMSGRTERMVTVLKRHEASNQSLGRIRK